MYEFKRFYIDGAWVTPPGRRELATARTSTRSWTSASVSACRKVRMVAAS